MTTMPLDDIRFEGDEPLRFTVHDEEFEATRGTALTGGDWVIRSTTTARRCTLDEREDGTWAAVSHSDFPHPANTPAEAVRRALADD